MKVFKKLSMLFVAAAMMMTTVSTAFAKNEDSIKEGTLKIQGTGRTYTAYRVLDSKEKSLSETTTIFTVNPDFEEFFSSNEDGFNFDSDKGILLNNTVVKGIDALPETENTDKIYDNQSDENIKLTTALVSYLNGKNISNENKYSFKSNEQVKVRQGLYLILDDTMTFDGDNMNTSDKNENKGRVPSKPILVRVDKDENVNIYAKDAVLDVTKLVDNKKDNVSGIGDIINYTISTSIPTYGNDYTNIQFRIKDKLSNGLTYKGNLKISIGGTEKTYEECLAEGLLIVKNSENEGSKNYTSIPSDDTKGASMQIEFNYDKLAETYKGQTIVVSYDAMINEDANVGIETNKNDATLEYTNKPNGETNAIPVETQTYSYAINIMKRSGANQDELLTGAVFTVYDDESCEHKVGELKELENKEGYYQLNGLGAKTYYIKETTPPSGYVALDGYIKLVIQETDDKTNPNITIVDVNDDIADFVSKGKIENGVIGIYVNNYKGINLPETGGMGTTIFMIGGAALIALAGVMLVVYSKKSKKA